MRKEIMIPRLQPRPSLRRPSGIENVYPTDANQNIDKDGKTDISDQTSSSASSIDRKPEVSCRLVSSTTPKSESPSPEENSCSLEADNQPLSPSRSMPEHDQSAHSPIPQDYGNQYKQMLMNYSSSTPNSLETDGSEMSYRDFSLTPPTAGSRPPLLVSAKRHGSEVRRQHNKRRRKRRRPTSTRSESENINLVPGKAVNSKGSDCGMDRDSGALCLWKSDSFEEPDDTCLPLLESSDDEIEQTDRIEEVVRAEHRKEAMVTGRNNNSQQKNWSFSANRAPPPKGW